MHPSAVYTITAPDTSNSTTSDLPDREKSYFGLSDAWSDVGPTTGASYGENYYYGGEGEGDYDYDYGEGEYEGEFLEGDYGDCGGDCGGGGAECETGGCCFDPKCGVKGAGY